MDNEELKKNAEDYIDKRINSISTSLKTNRESLNKLASICSSLEKHLKLNQSQSLQQLHKSKSPESKQTPKKPESRMKSPTNIKKPSEIPKKKIAEGTKTEEPNTEDSKKPESTLKKSESRPSVKKSLDFAESKKKEEEAKHKKTASTKPEDSKKPEKKDEEQKTKKFGLKPPKKPEETEDKTKKSPRAAEDAKKTEDAKKPEVKPKPSKIGLKSAAQEKKNTTQPASPAPDAQTTEPESFHPVAKTITYDEVTIKSKLESIPKVPHQKSEEIFIVSKGVQILLHSLSKLGSEKFYLTKNDPPEEFLWLFRIILQFINKEAADDQLWNAIKGVLTAGKDNRIAPGIGEKLISLAEEFDFSEENLEKVEKVVAGVEIDVKKFKAKCEISGILAHFVREALLFGAVSMNEGPDWRLVRRWEYKLRNLVS